MSFLPVIIYGSGIVVFGFLYWLLDGILREFINAGVHTTGNAFNLLMYLWVGCIVIYILFGGMWLIRKYSEAEYQRR